MKLAAALVAALVLGALPFVTSSNYIVGVGISALIFTVAEVALNLVYGFAGLLSFAQLGFWGIGGYAAALTVMTFGGSFWQGVLWAALLNGAIALLVGWWLGRRENSPRKVAIAVWSALAALVALALVQPKTAGAGNCCT